MSSTVFLSSISTPRLKIWMLPTSKNPKLTNTRRLSTWDAHCYTLKPMRLSITLKKISTKRLRAKFAETWNHKSKPVTTNLMRFSLTNQSATTEMDAAQGQPASAGHSYRSIPQTSTIRWTCPPRCPMNPRPHKFKRRLPNARKRLKWWKKTFKSGRTNSHLAKVLTSASHPKLWLMCRMWIALTTPERTHLLYQATSMNRLRHHQPEGLLFPRPWPSSKDKIWEMPWTV